MKRSKRERRSKRKRTLARVKNQALRKRIQKIEQEFRRQLVLQRFVECLFPVLLPTEPPRKSIARRGKLTLEERIYLYRDLYNRIKIAEIARRLGRHRTTIDREIKRNRPLLKLHSMDCYSLARHAHDMAEGRKARKRQRERMNNFTIRSWVEAELRKKVSPELISIRMLIELGKSVSHEAIYQWIYEERRDLIPFLVRGKQSYHRRTSLRRKRSRRRQPAAPKTSIDLRPKRVTNRTEFGHWEMDTIISRQSKECLFVLQERLSRYFFVVKLDTCSAELVLQVVLRLLRPLGKDWVKSITCDNGPENSCHNEITKQLGIPVYFCHPYCSSERGGVENRNGLLRHDFPKKTNFALVSEEEIQNVRQRWLRRPMKCLDGLSPYEVFTGTMQPVFKIAA